MFEVNNKNTRTMSMAKLQGHGSMGYYRDGYAKVGVRSFLGSKPTKNNIEGI